ncbi:hypothetical protein SMACR_07565 [Sordaria macrospora]|uniref:WGS project CABT00000000 data, contig 2.27 n=2 Tax=Sordaria macrospora TaxID=5147 RepID=F7W487_SORMK|nr:uncharacterized protein SMAC_07565 [Sordaria macrospora k-hell]KAA8634949.1 hypothetical protein SMACR_07565 [Sordaria macrospora]WPJ67338.1 hypothetical protein SMAC4_07565 [Sordaria macrospora]CCC14840.1 unnamed protein product [Sordaria macrospora k-hell]
MSARYERVNAQADDDDDHHNDTPTPTNNPTSRPSIPNSPPPSFHSRASSIHNNQRPVNPDLADAFGADEDDDDSDDDADDRQRLMRRNSSPTDASGAAGSTDVTSGGSSRPGPERQTTQLPATPYTATAGGSTTRPSGRVYGGGIQNEGVFSNLTAKPERNNGAEKEELPPSYEQAAADAAPPYWETTILAPGLGGPDDVYIEGMPVGSIVSFIWNGMISMSFQLVGFLLTYLLHSTHAAKNGSRAGLGITLIQFGFMMKGTQDSGADDGSGYTAPPDPNSHDFDPGQVDDNRGGDSWGSVDSSDWVAYILMLAGWFILIKSVSDYLKVRRHEMLVLQSPDRGLGIPIIATGEAPERVV